MVGKRSKYILCHSKLDYFHPMLYFFQLYIPGLLLLVTGMLSGTKINKVAPCVAQSSNQGWRCRVHLIIILQRRAAEYKIQVVVPTRKEKNLNVVLMMSSAVSQSEGRSGSVVWRYGTSRVNRLWLGWVSSFSTLYYSVCVDTSRHRCHLCSVVGWHAVEPSCHWHLHLGHLADAFVHSDFQ